MSNKSKVKGNNYEREICEKFTKWYERVYSGEVFNRVPSSGALRWNGKTFRYSDILPPENFRCLIECKHHKKITIYDFFTKLPKKANQDVVSWWNCQVLVDIQRCFDDTGQLLIPLLVFKKDRNPSLIVMERRLFKALNMRNVTLLVLSSRYLERDLVMFPLSQFLKMSPKDFNNVCKQFTKIPTRTKD